MLILRPLDVTAPKNLRKIWDRPISVHRNGPLEPCPESEKRRVHWRSRHNETDIAQPWKVSMFHTGTRDPRGLTLVLILLQAGCGRTPPPVPSTVAEEPQSAISRQWLGRWNG